MSTGTLVAGPLPKIGRKELEQIPVPEATLTHKPVPHHVIVEALVETLSFRHIARLLDGGSDQTRRPKTKHLDFGIGQHLGINERKESLAADLWHRKKSGVGKD